MLNVHEEQNVPDCFKRLGREESNSSMLPESYFREGGRGKVWGRGRKLRYEVVNSGGNETVNAPSINLICELFQGRDWFLFCPSSVASGASWCRVGFLVHGYCHQMGDEQNQLTKKAKTRSLGEHRGGQTCEKWPRIVGRIQTLEPVDLHSNPSYTAWILMLDK